MFRFAGKIHDISGVPEIIRTYQEANHGEED
jgi:hypothetical protein